MFICSQRYKLYDWELRSNPKIQYGFASKKQISTLIKIFGLNKLKPPFVAVLDFDQEVTWQNKDNDFSSLSLDKLVNLSLTDILKQNITKRSVNLYNKVYDWIDDYIEPKYALIIGGSFILLLIIMIILGIKILESMKEQNTQNEKELLEKKEQ